VFVEAKDSWLWIPKCHNLMIAITETGKNRENKVTEQSNARK
jgi:hypothetical protein